MILFENQIFDFDSTDKLVQQYPEFAPIHDFICRWRSGSKSFEFKTSGSTGAPKNVKIHRSQIEASVRATQNFLDLDRSDTALLALNPEYIASIMMAARALIIGMDLVITKPTSMPASIVESNDITLASFVPLQIYRMIEGGMLNSMEKVNKILIGGAPLNPKAFEILSSLNSDIYITYGMTETVSHIALMPVKGKYHNASFEVLSNIEVGMDQRNCLWVKGEVTSMEKLQTNDVVEFQNSRSFKWLGRADNIINSGGVKIHPETLEMAISETIDLPQEQFFVEGLPDDTLGKKLVIFIEPKVDQDKVLEKITNRILHQFNKYHIPKKVISGIEFERTENGKIQRNLTTRKYS